MRKRLIVGITGASGAPIAVSLLQMLREVNVEAHLIITHGGERTICQETSFSPEDVRSMAAFSYSLSDIGAAPASGTWECLGMVIVPCSMKTVAGIWSGYSDNLLLRAGDVTLKEGRKLVLVARETPLSPIHLRNLHDLSIMGATILPPMVSYYHHPNSLEDVTDHLVGKILDRFQLSAPNFHRWKGESHD